MNVDRVAELTLHLNEVENLANALESLDQHPPTTRRQLFRKTADALRRLVIPESPDQIIRVSGELNIYLPYGEDGPARLYLNETGTGKRVVLPLLAGTDCRILSGKLDPESRAKLVAGHLEPPLGSKVHAVVHQVKINGAIDSHSAVVHLFEPTQDRVGVWGRYADRNNQTRVNIYPADGGRISVGGETISFGQLYELLEAGELAGVPMQFCATAGQVRGAEDVVAVSTDLSQVDLDDPSACPVGQPQETQSLINLPVGIMFEGLEGAHKFRLPFVGR